MAIKTYISPLFEAKGLLGISPDVAIACIFSAQFNQWLPDKQHVAVGWSIKVHPDHRLDIVGNAWSGQKTVDDCIEMYLGAVRKGIS